MNLSKITQLVSTRAGTQIQVCLIPDSEILNMKAEAESQLLKNSHIPHYKTVCMSASIIVYRRSEFREDYNSSWRFYTGDDIMVGQGDILRI